MALIGFVFVTVFFGPAAGLLLTADALLGCWVLLSAGNALLARVLPGRPIQVRIIAVTVVAFGAGAIVGFGAFVIGQGSVAGRLTWLGSTVITGAMAWLLTIGRAVDEQQGFDEESLAAAVSSLRWEVARVGQVQWHQQQALSRALHGPIQSAVTAAAIRLDGAARSGADTTSLIEQTREQLREALSLLGDGQASLTPMTDTLTALREAWRGVCRVDDTSSPAAIDALDADELCRSCVGEVLTEAVSNAVRHGGAEAIDITIELGDNVVCIEVRDDGTGSDADASPGLGTRILAECSTQWHRGAIGDRHVLTASLPIAL
jgi:signal transduction histidine kinase